MTRRSEPNPAYWEQYGPFQHVKHELIRCYLNGWYPKLGTWARRVLYVDTHAGRGRYEGGNPGSPVLALQTLLRHSYRDKLLNASEFNFLFIERDPANRAALEAELSQLKPFPARVNVETSEGDAFERLSSILAELRRDRAQMAPAFLFVDPYGSIPAGLLGDLMKAGRVELFINVMWRELDMLIQQRPAPGTPHAQTLDEIFGSGSWRAEVIGEGMDERLDRAIPLMARGIGARLVDVSCAHGHWWAGDSVHLAPLDELGRWPRPDEGMCMVGFSSRRLHGSPVRQSGSAVPHQAGAGSPSFARLDSRAALEAT